MKKNKEIEVVVCDYCGKDATHKCPCDKDICNTCGVQIGKSYGLDRTIGGCYFTSTEEESVKGNICRSHIDPKILEKLKEEK